MPRTDEDWQYTDRKIERAYCHLLSLPHGESRVRLQSVLASLRDELAFLKGDFPQDVQERYEAEVQQNPELY